MILRDPVHGLVTFESDEVEIIPTLLATREVQRLRRIRQLGLASYAYPGADHTRFSHALGTAHVMTRYLRRLRDIDQELPYWQRVTTENARDAVAASLLHDVGHGPFSHLFEDAIPEGPSHEEWSARLVMYPDGELHRLLSSYDTSLPERVVGLIRGKHRLSYLSSAVSGTFDVDRCDYLLRDAHFTGVSYGAFDLDWLLRSLRFGHTGGDGPAPPIAIDGSKGLPAIESFIMARLFMFQQVYFHKATRAADWMMRQVLGRVRELVLDGTRVGAVPPAMLSLLRDGDTTCAEYLELDDIALLAAMSEWRHCSDPYLSEMSTRLHERKLYKTYELHGSQRDQGPELLQIAQDIASSQGFDAERHVGLDEASDTPYDEEDSPLRVVFPSHSPRRPSQVSFILGRLSGEKLRRVRLIFPPSLRDEIEKAVASTTLASSSAAT